MQTASLDILEKAHLPAPQARAILQVMELELKFQSDALATKADMALLRSEMDLLRADMAILRSDMAVLRSDMRAEFEQMRTELIRWTIGIQLSVVSLVLGAVYFMLTHVHP